MASALALDGKSLALDKPLPLDSGQDLPGVRLAYEAYGELNADKSNAILIFHALTGDQYVASTHPITGKPGWWDRMVGPGKPIDTNRFHVICANVVGGCMGSTGPASTGGSLKSRRPCHCSLNCGALLWRFWLRQKLPPEPSKLPAWAGPVESRASRAQTAATVRVRGYLTER